MPLQPILNSGPIDHKDPIYSDVLEDLQGNILNGHGRDHALHLFVRFKAGQRDQAADWVSKFAEAHVTSAKKQFDDSAKFKTTGKGAEFFAHLALSAAGYKFFEFPAEQLPPAAKLQDRPEDLNGVPFYDPEVFQKGMKSRGKVLRDPDTGTWEPGYADEIHAMILLATDRPQDLIRIELEVLGMLEPVADIIVRERGYALHRQFGRRGEPEYGVNVEHFGYVDGRSQPLFLKEQVEEENSLGGIDLWNPGAPLKLLLVQDPNGVHGVSFGSFLVYRKLEQNVRAFKQAQKDLANEMGLPVKLVGAMAVGRFEDGTPVVQQPADGQNPILNNFNYNADPRAQTCPLHAHLRKSNPRLESVNIAGPFAKSEAEELGHRIARRGIPYGGPLTVEDDRPDELPTNGVGLLFFCYQSDIWEQFEFIQRFWCNNPGFLEPGLGGAIGKPNPNYDKTGIDAIIGQGGTPDGDDPVVNESGKPPDNWPAAWGKPTRKVTTDFAQFVTLKGGEYFFSPSISFLKRLPHLMPGGIQPATIMSA